MALLQLDGIDLAIGDKPILSQITLSLDQGKVLAIVGESGSGKSMTAMSVMQLLPEFSRLSGSIRFAGAELVGQPERAMCRLRGDDLGMIFQEPMTALNPLQTIGEQIAEGVRLHARVDTAEATDRARDMLERVGLPPSRVALSRYPHELSGGQRQRVCIAIACAMRPKLLIADEPTTALDVTIQAQILDLLNRLVDEEDMALMLISHDLGVVADMADEIAIMREGRIVEEGPARDVLKTQRHPYTRQLAEASTHVPTRRSSPVASAAMAQRDVGPLLNIEGLVCEYAMPRESLFRRAAPFRAVDDVDLAIYPGQTMGLVGESGCGKSTLARTLLGLQPAAAGTIVFDGFDIGSGDADQIAAARREMQIVFQDPFGSFNPRHRVERLVAEPLHLRPELGPAEKRERVAQALTDVGLSTADMRKYPHAFSGGQRQRLAIARALVIRPKLIIADEPVSALDVSIRAQILDLLSALRDEHGIAYLFISHDLSVVRALCEEVVVMRAGRIVEHGETQRVFAEPRSSYTRELVAAAPDLHRILAAHEIAPPQTRQDG